MMPSSLSEKAKGKQRAVDSITDVPETLSRELMVRFTEGIPDLVLRVEEKDSVRDVKLKVCSLRPADAGRPVLIAKTRARRLLIRFEQLDRSSRIGA